MSLILANFVFIVILDIRTTIVIVDHQHQVVTRRLLEDQRQVADLRPICLVVNHRKPNERNHPKATSELLSGMRATRIRDSLDE